MAWASGDTGVACPWLEPGVTDPAVLQIDKMPAEFEVVSGTLEIVLESAARYARLRLVLDPYDLDALRTVLGAVAS